MSNKKSFILSSIKMAIATLTSRILGFGREILLANIFGASGLTDAFHIAFRIPNMLRDLFAEGAFSSAFVPIFTDTKKEGDEAAKKLLWSMAVVLFVLTGIISILIVIFAPQIIEILTNELFTQDVQRFELSVLLTRIMAPFLTMVSIAALFMGVLNTYKMFFAPALAPAAFNVIMILAMIFLPKLLEGRGIHSIVSLGIGVIIGGTIQMLIQIPLLKSKGLLTKVKVNLRSPEVKEILNRMSIGTIGVAATQINLLVATFIATGTIVGAVSWLQYAFRLFQFPVGILGVSIGNSNLVHFSQAWKNGEKKEAVDCLQTSYMTSLLVLIPALALIYALANDCVIISFQRGQFTPHDTEMVVTTLKYYLVGLPFYGLYKVFAPSFYSLDKPKIPVFISTVAIACNIIFCLSFVETYGFRILALGTSLSMIFIILTQSIVLYKILELRASFFFPLRFFKVMIAGSLCYVATIYVRENLFDVLQPSIWKYLCALGLSAVSGAITYGAALCLLGDYKIVAQLFKRISKRK